jgi:hypothetical protein
MEIELTVEIKRDGSKWETSERVSEGKPLVLQGGDNWELTITPTELVEEGQMESMQTECPVCGEFTAGLRLEEHQGSSVEIDHICVSEDIYYLHQESSR